MAQFHLVVYIMMPQNFPLIAIVVFTITVVGLGNGLKCRLENDLKTQEEFEEIVKNCLNVDNSDSNNRNQGSNNNRPWNQRGNDQRNNNNRGRNDKDDDDRDEDRSDGNRRGNNGAKRKQQGRFNTKDSSERDYDYESDKWNNQDNNKRRQPTTNKRNGDSYSTFGSNRKEQNDDPKRPNDPFNRQFNTSRGISTKIGSPLDDIDACVVHCIFRQMKMASDDSYLNRNTVLTVLTRRIKDQELKAFVQETVNECFETLDHEDEDMCDYSKSFAMCIEEKGKANCEDWDLTSKFGGKNRNKNNNNSSNSNNNNNNNNGGFTFQHSQTRG